MEGLVNILGYSRYQGTRATVSVTVTLFDTDGGTIPAGTVFAYQYVASGIVTEYIFESTSDTLIEAPFTSATVELTSPNVGVIPVIPDGTYLVPLSVNVLIDSVVTISDTFVNGDNADNQGTYLSGATTYLRSLSSGFLTSGQIEAGILTDYRNVARCKVFDLTNADGTLLFAGADEAGYVAIFVYGKNRALTTSEIAEIQTYVVSKTVPGLTIGTANFSTASFSVTVDLNYDAGYTSSSVETLVDTLLTNNFSITVFPNYEDKIRSSAVSRTLLSHPAIVSINSISLTPSTTVFASGVTNTTTTVSGLSGMSSTVHKGWTISGTNIPSGATIVSVTNATTVVISSTATGSGTNQVIISPFVETTASADLTFRKKGLMPSIISANISKTLSAVTI